MCKLIKQLSIRHLARLISPPPVTCLRMERGFTDWVNELWQAVRDPAALTVLLLELRQLDHQQLTGCGPRPEVNPWFPPLLFRRLTADELNCVLPLPSTNSLPSNILLVASLLQAILLPMRASVINPDVTFQLIDALGYSLDANSGILAMISGSHIRPNHIAIIIWGVALRLVFNCLHSSDDVCLQEVQKNLNRASFCHHTLLHGSGACGPGK